MDLLAVPMVVDTEAVVALWRQWWRRRILRRKPWWRRWLWWRRRWWWRIQR
ncbi:hypothetical protein Hanom_Chr16g01506801 [Helianthus anomalus]